MPTMLTVLISRRAADVLNKYGIDKSTIFESIERAYEFIGKEEGDHEFFIADRTNRFGIVGKASASTPNMIVQVWLLVPSQTLLIGCNQWFPDLEPKIVKSTIKVKGRICNG